MNSSIRCLSFALALLPLLIESASASLECVNWQPQHPDWLWCDDFESDSSLNQDYYDIDRGGGRFGVTTQTALSGNGSLRASYVAGGESAGNLKLSLGSSPVEPAHYIDRKFDELYWRFYMKTGPNWIGQGMKLTRAMIFTSSDLAQAAIGHLWEDSKLGLGLDPVSGVYGATVLTTGWNDFAHFTWLGKVDGTTQIYSVENREKWFCIEVHMKLNTPGKSDGVFGFSINGRWEAQENGLNWRGSYTNYGINAIMLENWINGGAPHNQDRYFDNFVVSTQPIGCRSDPGPVPPSGLNVR